MAAARIAARVDEMLALVQMSGYASAGRTQLSGGQRQRVALARALAKLPEAAAARRAAGRARPQAARGDPARADRHPGAARHRLPGRDARPGRGDGAGRAASAVMDRGRLVQIGAPAEIYERPTRRFVADFIGDDEPHRRRGGLLLGSRPARCWRSPGDCGCAGTAGRVRDRGDGGVSRLPRRAVGHSSERRWREDADSASAERCGGRIRPR